MKKNRIRFISTTFIFSFIYIAIIFFASCENKNNDAISLEIQHLRGATINLKLSNNGSSDLVFLNLDTPINGHFNQYFKITNENGDQVPYVGLLTSIHMASAKWSKLKSEESINIPVDLSKNYDFSSATGRYTITYLYQLHFTKGNNDSRNTGYDPSNIEKTNLASNEIEIEISDIEDIKKEGFGSVEGTRFECSADKTPLAEAAKAFAANMASDNIAYIKNNKMDDFWNTWWGVDNNSRYEFILDGFEKISTSFGESWSFDCPDEGAQSSCEGVTAQTVKTTPYKIRLCPTFFYFNDYQEYQGKVLIHEAAHWNINLGAEDYAYFYEDCKNLAKNDPEKAKMNADNYGMFSLALTELEPTDTNEPPVAGFSYSVNQLIVQFTDQSTDPENKISSREWDFGDGKTSTATNPKHTFSSAGTYSVKLTVTDDEGLSNSISKNVIVTAPNDDEDDDDEDNEDNDDDETDDGCGSILSFI